MSNLSGIWSANRGFSSFMNPGMSPLGMLGFSCRNYIFFLISSNNNQKNSVNERFSFKSKMIVTNKGVVL